MALSSTFGRWLLGLAGLVLASAASAQAPRDVTIGISSNSLGASGFRLAKEMGPFERHGLNARIITTDSGSSVAAAMLWKMQ